MIKRTASGRHQQQIVKLVKVKNIEEMLKKHFLNKSTFKQSACFVVKHSSIFLINLPSADTSINV